ncbi:MAG: zinc ribbon domain-containing protein [Candidatus Atribacteria bacterium]|nr:zinc ribbon domain-containing protein [Candidatus Atribacteria bacterium]
MPRITRIGGEKIMDQAMEFPKGPICQSCGMPLQKDTDFGTDADRSKNKEYCFHCFKDGKFLDEGITLKEKIEKNVEFAIKMGMPEDAARKMCENILPKLKRWRKE